ncbi:MAG: hypothetical protein JWN47_1940, partial [Frankiales bacterium]|nr:hypothetical protein [Frankiales bacterium]
EAHIAHPVPVAKFDEAGASLPAAPMYLQRN